MILDSTRNIVEDIEAELSRDKYLEVYTNFINFKYNYVGRDLSINIE